jgi:lysophospholipase
MARRALAALACVLTLGACDMAGPREPLLDSRAPPELASRFYPPEGWAWGLVQADGEPVQRYGVASPPLVPRGEVVILPGEGESAETWFETARDLAARGAVVWILDRSGRGGSARPAAPRGLVQAPDPEADVEGLRTLRAAAAMGGPSRKLVLLAADDAAAPALRAVEMGAPFDAVILSAPRLPDGALSPLQAFLVRIGLGRLPAAPLKAWRRDGPDDRTLGLTHDPWRARVRRAWATANPDLRDTGLTLATRAGLTKASKAVLEAPAPKPPLLVMLPEKTPEGAEALLQHAPGARVVRLKGALRALHLEHDEVREAWLDAIAETAGLPPQPIAGRLDRD